VSGRGGLQLGEGEHEVQPPPCVSMPGLACMQTVNRLTASEAIEPFVSTTPGMYERELRSRARPLVALECGDRDCDVDRSRAPCRCAWLLCDVRACTLCEVKDMHVIRLSCPPKIRNGDVCPPSHSKREDRSSTAEC
jgi:hypothetical protein